MQPADRPVGNPESIWTHYREILSMNFARAGMAFALASRSDLGEVIVTDELTLT